MERCYVNGDGDTGGITCRAGWLVRAVLAQIKMGSNRVVR